MVIINVPESKHCPVSSDCRLLIAKTGPQCHKNVIGKFFDVENPPSDVKCLCCYECIKTHSDSGCSSCTQFLNTFLPLKTSLKLSKSVSSEVKCALLELFDAMAVKQVKVEDDLELSPTNFVSDLIKVIDEIKRATDIVDTWHVSLDLAIKVFSTLNDVLYGEDLSDYSDSDSSDESEVDVFDEDANSSEDDINEIVLPDIF